MRSLTAPFNLREANILSLFTGFDGVQAFISIALLIRANVTFQGVAYGKNIIGGNKERAILGSLIKRSLTKRQTGDND